MDLYFIRTVLPLCVLILVVQSKFVTDDVGTWTDMAESCNLFKPDVEFEVDGLIARPNNVYSTLQDGDRVWVGYVREYRVLQLKGCADGTAVKDNIVRQKSVYSQEQCMFYCGSPEQIKFGLQHEQPHQQGDLVCFCFNDTIPHTDMTTNPGCNIACQGSELTCGRDGKVAIYEEVTNNDTQFLRKCKGWKTPQNNCLALLDSHKTNQARFTWENCSEEFHTNCSRDDSEDDDYESIDDGSGTEWSKAASTCQGAGESIRPYTSLQTSISTEAIIWTANVRVLAIMTIRKSNRTPTSQSRRYGYLHKSGNELFLNFTNDPDQTFKALCKQGNTPTTTTSRPTSVTEREDSDDESSSNTNIPAVSPLPSTNTNSQLIAVFICVPIAVVLISAFVVLAVLIRRGFIRPMWCVRKAKTGTPGTISTPPGLDDDAFYHEVDNIANIPESAGPPSNNAQPSDTITHHNGVGDYSYVTQAQINPTPNYFILEKEGNNDGNGQGPSQYSPGSSKKEHHNVYDKTNFHGRGYSSYDKIGQKCKAVNNGAVYDVAKYGVPMDNAYDTTSVRKVQQSGPDGFYNRLGDDGTNDTYTTCSQSTGLQARVDTTYDHTPTTGQ